MRAPSSIAFDAASRMSSSARRSPRRRLATGYRRRMTARRMPCLWPRTSSSGLRLTSGQLVVTQDRLRQHDLVARLRHRVEHVALGSDGGLQAGDHLLADGVQRRVGHLGEQLLEVVEQHPAGREHGDRGVGAHRADRLGPGARHRRDQQAELLVGVAEGLLTQHHPVVRHPECTGPAAARRGGTAGSPATPVGCSAASSDLISSSETVRPWAVSTRNIRPGCRRIRLTTRAGSDRDTDLGGHHHQAVLGDPDPGRAQAVAVRSTAPTTVPSEKHTEAGPSHGSIRRCVVGVEGPAGGVHRLLPLPRLGDHHQHRMGQAAAAEVQQFEHFVEAGGVRGAGVQIGKIFSGRPASRTRRS